jgi:hypothetical protein
MSDTRKAIVTTASVNDALKSMNDLNVKLGLPIIGTEFDKGARGKGFALYNSKGEAVQSFETKEQAYNLFSTFVEIGTLIITEGANVKLVEAPKEETAEVPAKTARKAAEKVSA